MAHIYIKKLPKPVRIIRGSALTIKPKTKSLVRAAHSFHVYGQQGHWHVIERGGFATRDKFSSVGEAIEFVTKKKRVSRSLGKYEVVIHSPRRKIRRLIS